MKRSVLKRRTRPKPGAPLRAMSEQREEQLRDTGRLVPGSTFAAAGKSMRSTRPACTGPDRNVVDAVLDRAAHSCERCGAGLHGQRGVDYSIHHRKLRAQGGDNSPANLVALCGHGTAGCHHEVHANPTVSRAEGWLVDRDQDPMSQPIPHALYGHICLSANGSVSSRRPTLSED